MTKDVIYANIPQSNGMLMLSQGVGMEQLAGSLGQRVRGLVVDDTGLTGRSAIRLAYRSEDPGPQGIESNLPSLFAAIEQDLGLHLESKKSRIQVLVVDHIDKVPTEN